MGSPGYKDFVKNLKAGDLVLLLDNNYYAAPVLFLNWNGDSATTGYRAQYLFIPDWDWADRYTWHRNAQDGEAEERTAQWWKDCFDGLMKDGNKSMRLQPHTINAQAEKRFYPFPKTFLTKNQKKFLKLINKIKGYEY